MNCLLLYSHHSGHHNLTPMIPFIKERLLARFDRVDFFCTFSLEEAKKVIQESAPLYDALIVAGGDGTFNNVINALSSVPNPPILGYINYGTIGDIGRNFGIGAGLKKSLDIITKGEIVPFDVGEINGQYFAYVCTIGRYSDIAYITPRKQKRFLGRIAYYNKAFKELQNRKVVHAHIEADGSLYEIDTPFILLLNGMNIGGFKINHYGSIQDGMMELFLAKKDISNGLMPLLTDTNRIVLQAKKFAIKTDEAMSWCLDGEEGPKGEANIVTHQKMFKIFAKKGFVK